jgi:hypothetical protein
MKFLKIHLESILILSIILFTYYLQGCNPTEERSSGNERKFVEAEVEVINPGGKIASGIPNKYALLLNVPYKIDFRARKYMSSTDGILSMQLSIPSQFIVLDGDRKWEGKDIDNELSVTVKPIETGTFEIKGTAINKTIDFSTENLIIIYVLSTQEELMQWLNSQE